ncbi:hypothetical protein B0T22DRAFT_161211 [Podospora appendiculata]|uniref:Peptidase M20 dimerisation domain-containing protein n=1 Tax=Podospora appendiculata TaxID=314037 RepID=A0AAE1CCP2_9PEZI|nr:hypothetical protein B0T22DRAFT_161211 [Podospora appendiculata]
MEKSAASTVLPLANGPLQKIRNDDNNGQPARPRRLVPGALILALTFYLYISVAFMRTSWPYQGLDDGQQQPTFKSHCVQPDALFPSQNNTELQRVYDYLSTDSFRTASIDRLSGAVKVKSVSFDDLGAVGEDPRWDAFYDFSAYLKATFPLIHAQLDVEKVNTHGLLYTWTGSDSSLRPTLLMAHQDTVPVPAETIDAWTHPPWSGHYDGKYIWGRGASDCKNQLIATLETVELLLEAKFQPKRTLLLSFGFDEECSGRQGAAQLSSAIEARYGKDGIAVIVDEGSGFEQTWGTTFAKPGTAEKGYTDVDITIRMPGGHSSVPADHTSIGVISDLITRIEAEQYRTHLESENPYFTQLQCGAAHSPDFPAKLKDLLAQRRRAPVSCRARPDHLAVEAAKQGPEIKYLMQTSQAVDVIAGGVKINALPESVTVKVNHRINVGDTAQLVYGRLTKLAGAVADKFNLTLHAFDGGKSEAPSSITLAASRNAIPVAPVTPVDEKPFEVLAGTIRALYGEEVVVTPGIMTGNTDTRYYWDLTRHIFRFGPGYDPDDEAGIGSIHTVNEKVSVLQHVNAVKWFTLFVLNMDEAEL